MIKRAVLRGSMEANGARLLFTVRNFSNLHFLSLEQTANRKRFFPPNFRFLRHNVYPVSGGRIFLPLPPRLSKLVRFTYRYGYNWPDQDALPRQDGSNCRDSYTRGDGEHEDGFSEFKK